MSFFDWLMEAKKVFPIKERPKKPKIASIAHTDIDRWLKSVDGLAKELVALKNLKDKAKNKMDQISKVNPKSDPKSDEKQKPDQELKTDKKPDQELINQSNQSNKEDNSDVKRRRVDPNSRKSKNIKDFDMEKNVE